MDPDGGVSSAQVAAHAAGGVEALDASRAGRFGLSRRGEGLFEAGLSGVGFGFLGVLGKASLASGLTPGENLSLRFLLSSAVVWLVALATRGRRARLARADVLKCVALGALGYASFSTCYFEALARLPASLTVLLLYTYPVLVALVARVVLKHALTPRLVRGLGLVTLGLVPLVATTSVAGGSGVGLALGLASALLYALYIVISGRVLGKVDALVAVAWIQLAAGVMLAAIHLREPGRVASLALAHWPSVVGLAVLCTALPMVLFIRSLQKVTPAEASLLSTAEPVTGVLLASVLLGERLTTWQLAGGAAVVAALVYISRPERTKA